MEAGVATLPEGGPQPLVYAPLPQLPVNFQSSRGGGGGATTCGGGCGAKTGCGGGGGGGE